MENPTGRGSTPAELPPLNLLGDQSDRPNGQSDSLYGASSDPLRQLEADLRLPIGFLDIQERPDRATPPENREAPKEVPPPRRESPRQEEPAPRKETPAPYYPEGDRVPPNRYPVPAPLPRPDYHEYPDQWSRDYRPSPAPRTYHQDQWWRQHQAPQTDWRDWRTYVPSPGPKNPHQDQWWRNHQRPGYPDQDWRRQDPRNEDWRRPNQDRQQQQEWLRRQQEIQRQQEWQRQQLERQRQRQPYPQDRQPYPQDRQPSPYDRQQNPSDRTREAMDPRLNESINHYLGKKVSQFDRTVPDELGCARAVALVLEKAYKIDIRSQGTDNLDQTLRKNGWVEVPSQEIASGDVIIGRRANRPGHAGIYVGGNEIFNNDSNAKRMQIDSLDKFRNPEFVTVKVYRKVR